MAEVLLQIELAQIELVDEAATRRLGAALAALARPGDIFALQGDLGTGKTALARAFITAAESLDEDEEVPSPTFTIVQTYDSKNGPIFHFDLYRIESPEEAWELDIEEAFASAISLIEWPERLAYLLPRRALIVSLSHQGGDARLAVLSGSDDWGRRLKEAKIA